MHDMLHALNNMSYDHEDALLALDEIQYDIWTIDLPIQTIIEWIKNNFAHTYPKRRHRWYRMLESQFRYMIITVKSYQIDRVKHELSTGLVASEELRKLYLHILENVRPCNKAPDHCTILIPCDFPTIMQELLRRQILYVGCNDNVVKLNKYARDFNHDV